jgi:hypothetical protein
MPSSDVEVRASERGVIIEAANLVARSARARAGWSKEIRNAISVSEVREWQDGLGIYVRVDLSIAPMARAFEYGSGIHATRDTMSPQQIGPRGKILIMGNPLLSFPGTNEFKGQTIITPVVRHPGVAPRPFLAPAIQENRDRIRKILSQAVRTSISKTIRESWYHSEK